MNLRNLGERNWAIKVFRKSNGVISECLLHATWQTVISKIKGGHWLKSWGNESGVIVSCKVRLKTLSSCLTVATGIFFFFDNIRELKIQCLCKVSSFDFLPKLYHIKDPSFGFFSPYIYSTTIIYN